MGLGAGYQVTTGLSVGIAWRPTFLSLNSTAAIPSDLDLDGNPDVLIVPEIQNANDLILSGFRLGAQYRPVDAKWGLGIALRSEDEFSANGKTKEKSEIAGSNSKDSIDGGDVIAKSRIPMKLSLGVHYDTSPQLRFMTQS